MNEEVVEEIAQALHVLANLDVTAFQRKGLTSSNCHLLPYALLGTRAQSHESGQLIRSLPLSLSLLMDLSAISPMLAFLKDPAPAFFIKDDQAQGTVQLQLHILLRFFTPGPTATHEYILSASSTSDQISKAQMDMVNNLFALMAHLYWPVGKDAAFLLTCVLIAHTFEVRCWDQEINRGADFQASSRLKVCSRPTQCNVLKCTELGTLQSSFPEQSTVRKRLANIASKYEDPEAVIRLAFGADEGSEENQSKLLEPILAFLHCQTPDVAQLELFKFIKMMQKPPPKLKRDEVYEPDRSQLCEDAIWLMRNLKRQHEQSPSSSICTMLGTVALLQSVELDIEDIQQRKASAQLDQPQMQDTPADCPPPSAPPILGDNPEDCMHEEDMPEQTVPMDHNSAANWGPGLDQEPKLGAAHDPGMDRQEASPQAAPKGRGKRKDKSIKPRGKPRGRKRREARDNRRARHLALLAALQNKRLIEREEHWPPDRQLPPPPPLQQPATVYDVLNRQPSSSNATNLPLHGMQQPKPDGEEDVIDLCSQSDSDGASSIAEHNSATSPRQGTMPMKFAADRRMEEAGHCYMDGRPTPTEFEKAPKTRKPHRLAVLNPAPKKDSSRRWKHDKYDPDQRHKKSGLPHHIRSSFQAPQVEEEVGSMLQEFEQELRDQIRCVIDARRDGFQSSCATRIVLDQGKPAVVVFADGGQETLKYVSDIPRILAGLRKLVPRSLSANDAESADPFQQSNSIGIPATLHRISALRNRIGTIVGLTCSIVRHQNGPVDGLERMSPEIAFKLARGRQAVLAVGDERSGRADLLREVTHMLADKVGLGSKVMIIDTRCELAGLADEPHRKVKNARRVQVADPEAQHSHITDAAALHGCEVLVLDEVCSLKDLKALQGAKDRGCAIMAGVQARVLEELCMSYPVIDLESEAQSRGELWTDSSALLSVFETIYKVDRTASVAFEDPVLGLKSIISSRRSTSGSESARGLAHRIPADELRVAPPVAHTNVPLRMEDREGMFRSQLGVPQMPMWPGMEYMASGGWPLPGMWGIPPPSCMSAGMGLPMPPGPSSGFAGIPPFNGSAEIRPPQPPSHEKPKPPAHSPPTHLRSGKGTLERPDEDAFGGVPPRLPQGPPRATRQTRSPPPREPVPIAEPVGNLTLCLPRIVTGGKYG